MFCDEGVPSDTPDTILLFPLVFSYNTRLLIYIDISWIDYET